MSTPDSGQPNTSHLTEHAMLDQLIDDDRRADCAANDAALGTQQPRELRPFRILIGKRGEPRLDFGAMSVDSVSAVMQHLDLCTVGERCEALPVRSGGVS